jgi:hypothetical protein
MIQHSTGTIWVGMDVHQSSITAAILHGDSPEPEVVRLPGDLNATRRLFRRLPWRCSRRPGIRLLAEGEFHPSITPLACPGAS